MGQTTKQELSMGPKEALLLLAVCAILSMVSVSGAANARWIILDYTIEIQEEELDHFHIKTRICPVQDSILRLAMTQNYGQLKRLEDVIKDISVSGDAHTFPAINRVGEFLWETGPIVDKSLVIDYAVRNRHPYSGLNSVRLPYRDANHLYFPAASVFIHPEEKYLVENNIKIQRIRINFDLPEGWIAVTSWGVSHPFCDLTPPSLENLNFGLVGLGDYRIHSFRCGELPVDVALLNPGPRPDAEIARVVNQAIISGYDLFGFFPMPKVFALFHFIFDHPGQVSGNSLGWSFNLNYGRRLDSSVWLKETGQIFHEIFHFWNGMDGAPLSRAQNDHSLIWFTEGITRFYQFKSMLRSYIISEEIYFQYISDELNTVYHSPRRNDNLIKISEDYYSDPNAMDLTYSKGCCLAFALEMLLQHISSGRLDFDNLMRRLLKTHDFRLGSRCLIHEDLDAFFRDVLGKKYYPSYEKLGGNCFIQEFEALMIAVGLQVEKNKGEKIYFGIIDFGNPSGPLRAYEVDAESPAFQAGLREQDVLLEVNGCRLRDIADIMSALKGVDEDEAVELVVERNGHQIKMRTIWATYETRLEIKRKTKKSKA